MDSQIVTLSAAPLGFALGMGLMWFIARGRIAAAAEQGKSAVLIELAIAREQVRSLEQGHQQGLTRYDALVSQSDAWRTALDGTRDENSRLAERASRVSLLEDQIENLQEEQKLSQQEILHLAKSEAEMAQSLQSKIARLAEIEQAHAHAEQALKQAGSEIARLNTQVAELNIRLSAERNQAEEKLALLLEAKEALSNQFKSLANDILEEKAKRFTEQNQTNLGQLLEPLKTKLQEFQGKVEEVYVQEGKDRTALAEQVRQLAGLNQSLSQDAKDLTHALKGSSKTQGNWGELVLERVLEASGLRKGEEYHVQESHTRDDDSRALLDVVIHLPEDRHLVIDAKVSLTAYEESISAEDEKGRQANVKRHLDSVRAHINGLSEKSYQVLYGLKSLDFILMFMPLEPAFMVAVTHDRDLLMHAWQKNVLLVSPSTLLFVVRTVAHLWRQEAQNRNAQEIAKRGAELYDKLVGFVEDLESLGNRLKQAQNEYHAAHNKLVSGKGNVIRQAEMLRQMGVKPSKTLSAALLEAAADEAAIPKEPLRLYPRRAQKPSATFLGENVVWEKSTSS